MYKFQVIKAEASTAKKSVEALCKKAEDMNALNLQVLEYNAKVINGEPQADLYVAYGVVKVGSDE